MYHLYDLLARDSGARQFFLTLPEGVQGALILSAGSIRTEADMRLLADRASTQQGQASNESEQTFR